MARDRRKKSGDSVKSQQKDTKDIKERRKKTTPQGTERNYQTHECHNKTSSPSSSSASSSSQDSRFCAKTDRRFLLDKLLPGKKKKESQLALLSEQQRAVRQEKLKQQRNRTAGKRGDDEENEASSCRGEEEEGDKKKNWNRGGVSPFRSSLQVSDWQNDERFARIFTDESFAVGGGGTGKVDKFGRKLDKKQGSEKTKKKQKGEEQEKKKVVEKRTSVGEDDEGDEEEELAQKNKVGEKEKRMQKKKAPSKAIEEEDEEEEGDAGDAAGSEDEAEEEENEEDEEAQEEEEVEEDHESTETSSTSSESEEDEDEEEEEGPSVWDQEGDGLVMGEEASRRLAVMGLEWENISADDLLLLFRSFVRDFLSSSSGAGLNGVSTGGEGEDKKKKGEAEGGWGKNTPEDIVRSVKIYPSDFGLKRMEIEAVKGPCIDWASVERGRRSSEGEEDESGEDEEAEADESGEEESEEQGEEEEESEGGEAEGKQEAAADDHDDEPSGEDEDKEESEASEQENEQDDEANEEEEGGGREQGMYVDSDTDVDDDDDLKPTEEEERLYNEALRKYEKERSQYYYAVVEFNSVASAKFFYDELDGCDISFAVDGLDLRFIPDELEFPHEPTSVSTLGSSEKAAAALLRYEPPPSMSTALRHSRVKCTWDENPAERTKLLRKKFTEKELRELDLQAYLASSSSEEEDDEEEDEAAAENSKTMGGGRKRWKVTEENLQEYRRQLLGDAADLSTDDEDDEEDYDISRKSDVKDNGKASGASSGIVISFDGELETLDQQSSREANEDFIIKEKKPRGITQADEEAWDNYVREKKKKEKQIQKREQKKFEAMRLREEEEGDEEEDEEKRSSLGETKGRKKETRKFPLFSSGTGGEDDEGTSDPESATLVNGESKKKKLQRSKRRAESTTERPQLSGNEAAELELLTLGHEEDARRHFDLRAELHDGKKKKRKLDRRCGRNEAENPSEKAEAEASFKVDVEDSRFSRLFSDPDFAIDPTNPHFKRTAATEELLKEKRMRSSQQKLAAFKQPPHDVLRSQQAKNTTVQKRKGGDVVSTERCSVDTGAGTLEKETEAKKKKTKTGNFSLFASKKCEAL